MKISEITDENSTWAVLTNSDFNNIIESFELILKSWPVVLGSRSPTLINHHKKNLALFLDAVKSELQNLASFPDQKDPDLKRIQGKLNIIQNHVEELIRK